MPEKLIEQGCQAIWPQGFMRIHLLKRMKNFLGSKVPRELTIHLSSHLIPEHRKEIHKSSISTGREQGLKVMHNMVINR